jgi:uncharacterized membrane protein
MAEPPPDERLQILVSFLGPYPLCWTFRPLGLGRSRCPAAIQVHMDDQYHPVALSETGRTEAFSDGVLAIAVTLLVLDLHVPPRNILDEPLSVALAHEWPAYAAYMTSFLIIGIIWVNHHAVFQLVGRVDRSVQFLNLVLLMSVVAIPFATALLSEYLLAGDGNARSAALVYSAVMLAMSFGFTALYSYVALHPVLLADGVDPGAVHGSIVRFSAVGIGLYVVTLGIAVVSAPACLVAHFVIAIYYCFQQIRITPLNR